jgi:hypothetical protein
MCRRKDTLRVKNSYYGNRRSVNPPSEETQKHGPGSTRSRILHKTTVTRNTGVMYVVRASCKVRAVTYEQASCKHNCISDRWRVSHCTYTEHVTTMAVCDSNLHSAFLFQFETSWTGPGETRTHKIARIKISWTSNLEYALYNIIIQHHYIHHYIQIKMFA